MSTVASEPHTSQRLVSNGHYTSQEDILSPNFQDLTLNNSDYNSEFSLLDTFNKKVQKKHRHRSRSNSKRQQGQHESKKDESNNYNETNTYELLDSIKQQKNLNRNGPLFYSSPKVSSRQKLLEDTKTCFNETKQDDGCEEAPASGQSKNSKLPFEKNSMATGTCRRETLVSN